MICLVFKGMVVKNRVAETVTIIYDVSKRFAISYKVFNQLIFSCVVNNIFTLVYWASRVVMEPVDEYKYEMLYELN